MRRNICYCILFVLVGSLSAQPLKIAVISDLHYLSSELVEEGVAYEYYIKQTGRSISDLHVVLHLVLTEIVDLQPDIVLVPGDLTNHGEKESHQSLLRELQILLDNDIKVCVIPGNHDVGIPNSKSYMSDGVHPVESVTSDDFESLYASFGYSSAVDRDGNSLSYLSELNDSIWLLAIDTNKYDEYEDWALTSGHIKDETMQWALQILEEAQKKGVLVLGMMHHGLVEHLPFQSFFFTDYLVEDWYNKASELANAGLQVVFTGHFHSNDITELETKNGDKIFDIETGSLAHYPFPYRYLEFNNKEVKVRSKFIDMIPGDEGFRERYKNIFEEKVLQIITSKLKGMGFLVFPEFEKTLTELLIELSILHVEGDESISLEKIPNLEHLIYFLGSEIPDSEELTFDFPPEDNNLTIYLK